MAGNLDRIEAIFDHGADRCVDQQDIAATNRRIQYIRLGKHRSNSGKIACKAAQALEPRLIDRDGAKVCVATEHWYGLIHPRLPAGLSGGHRLPGCQPFDWHARCFGDI